MKKSTIRSTLDIPNSSQNFCDTNNNKPRRNKKAWTLNVWKQSVEHDDARKKTNIQPQLASPSQIGNNQLVRRLEIPKKAKEEISKYLLKNLRPEEKKEVTTSVSVSKDNIKNTEKLSSGKLSQLLESVKLDEFDSRRDSKKLTEKNYEECCNTDLHSIQDCLKNCLTDNTQKVLECSNSSERVFSFGSYDTIKAIKEPTQLLKISEVVEYFEKKRAQWNQIDLQKKDILVDSHCHLDMLITK